MSNIPAFIPVRGEVILPITSEVEGRVGRGYSVLDGLSGAEQGTPDMTIAIAAGTVRENYVPKSVTAGNATHDASDVSLGRKDIIYISGGAIAVWKGDNLAVVDPQGNGNWREYTSPYPKAGCPAGVPLYEVYIAPGDAHLHSDALRSIAQYDSDFQEVMQKQVQPYGLTILAGYIKKFDCAQDLTTGLSILGATGGLVLMEW